MGVPVFDVNRFSGFNSMENTGMSIGTRLKQARKDARLSQIELEKRSGVSQSAISDLERGKSAGSTSVAGLASVLGVRALWLETGKGPKNDAEGVQKRITPSTWFNEEAYELLEIYFSLDDEERDDVLRLMKSRVVGRQRAVGGDS